MTSERRHTMRLPIGKATNVTAAGLVTCLLVLHVGVFSRVATHSFQHAHHKAATHASFLCTWLCTAGEISEVVDADLGTTAPLGGWAEPSAPTDVVVPPAFAPASRGPPLLLL